MHYSTFRAAQLIAIVALVPVPAVADEAPPSRPTQVNETPARLTVSFEPLSLRSFVREPNARHPHLQFKVEGEDSAGVRAARVFIDHAVDDAGRMLHGETDPKFVHVSVGSSSRRDFLGPIPPAIETTLSAVAPEAKTVKALRGRIELVLPALHPNATATIAHALAYDGAPVESPTLRAAGVTVQVFGRAQSAAVVSAQLAIGVPGAAPIPPAELAKMSPRVREIMTRPPVPELEACDLRVIITDPEQRLVGFEFVAADDSPLIYNRNGIGHFQSESKRISTYRLESPIPGDLKLICWLATERSTLVIPIILADVPLPPFQKTATPSEPTAANRN